MSKLKEQIENNLKQAMYNKKIEEISVLRMIKNAIKNKEIMLRKGGPVCLSAHDANISSQDSLTNEQIIEVLRSEIKKRKDAIQAFEQGNRQDLAEKEKNEIIIIEKYLPKQLSNEEIAKVAREVAEAYDNASVQNFGIIMGQVMVKVKGKADGSRVSEIVRNVLTR